MDKSEALMVLSENVKSVNIRKHCLAVSAIMEDLAKKLREDPEKWMLTGMLHDLDYERTENSMEKHGLETAKILEGKVSEEIIHAIKAHNSVHTKEEAREKMDIALIASDALSGLIISTALVMPSKKLDEVTVEVL